jgi:hypothetical protein
MRRLNAWLARLGAAGVLGIGVLAAAGFYASALAPAERELAAQRLAAERLKARIPYQPVGAGGRAEELRRFHSLFPPVDKLTDELERVYSLARNARLELAQGEYRLEKREAGLWSYRVSLPLRGTYPQIREFLGAVLGAMPIASVDALQFERKKADEALLEAQVRLTLHFQPGGSTDAR